MSQMGPMSERRERNGNSDGNHGCNLNVSLSLTLSLTLTLIYATVTRAWSQQAVFEALHPTRIPEAALLILTPILSPSLALTLLPAPTHSEPKLVSFSCHRLPVRIG